jgi:hypothetical protein
MMMARGLRRPWQRAARGLVTGRPDHASLRRRVAHCLRSGDIRTAARRPRQRRERRTPCASSAALRPERDAQPRRGARAAAPPDCTRPSSRRRHAAPRSWALRARPCSRTWPSGSRPRRVDEHRRRLRTGRPAPGPASVPAPPYHRRRSRVPRRPFRPRGHVRGGARSRRTRTPFPRAAPPRAPRRPLGRPGHRPQLSASPRRARRDGRAGGASPPLSHLVA